MPCKAMGNGRLPVMVVLRRAAGNRGTNRVLNSQVWEPAWVGGCSWGPEVRALQTSVSRNPCRPRGWSPRPGLPDAPAGRKKAPFFISAHANAIKQIRIIALLAEWGIPGWGRLVKESLDICLIWVFMEHAEFQHLFHYT